MVLELAQVLELAELVEAEARWDNLRKYRLVNRGQGAPDDLSSVQRAYDSFHRHLVAYNRRHRPIHVGELLLNTTKRLGPWCATMSDLFEALLANPKVACPVNLVEKAYRRAEHIAIRMRQDPPTRRSPPETIQVAIEDLRAVIAWCDSSPQVAKPTTVLECG